MVSNNSNNKSKLLVKNLPLSKNTALHMEQNDKLLQKLNQEGGGESCSTLPEGSKKQLPPLIQMLTHQQIKFIIRLMTHSDNQKPIVNLIVK